MTERTQPPDDRGLVERLLRDAPLIGDSHYRQTIRQAAEAIQRLSEKPCPHVVSSDEGTHFCGLDADNKATIESLRSEVARLSEPAQGDEWEQMDHEAFVRAMQAYAAVNSSFASKILGHVRRVEVQRNESRSEVERLKGDGERLEADHDALFAERGRLRMAVFTFAHKLRDAGLMDDLCHSLLADAASPIHDAARTSDANIHLPNDAEIAGCQTDVGRPHVQAALQKLRTSDASRSTTGENA